MKTPICQIALAVSLGIILTPCGLSAAPKPKALVVRDAVGTRVGLTVGTEFVNDVTVALQQDDITFLVRVGSENFTGNTDALSFESTDCTGEPFLSFFPQFLLRRVAIAPPDQTAYVGGGDAVLITTQSLFFEGSCTTSSPFSQTVQPVVLITNLSDRFIPPFSADLE